MENGAGEAVRFAEVELALGVESGAPIEIEVPGGVMIRVRDIAAAPGVASLIRELRGC